MTTIISDKDGNLIDASSATIPSDRHFRNAWTLSGSTITEDLTAAKTLFKEKIREVRKPLLESEDVVYMKALESSDSSAQSASVTKKKCTKKCTSCFCNYKRCKYNCIKKMHGIQVYWVIHLTHNRREINGIKYNRNCCDCR